MAYFFIFIFLCFISSIYSNDFPSPSREQLEAKIKQLDLKISSKCRQERLCFMGTAACAFLLIYYRTGFNYEHSGLYYSELIVKEAAVLFGGYCVHTYRELSKERKKIEKNRDKLELELKSIRPNAIRPGEKVKIPRLPLGENTQNQATSAYSGEYQTTITRSSALPVKLVAIEDSQGNELINLQRPPKTKRHGSAIVLRSPRNSTDFDQKS